MTFGIFSLKVFVRQMQCSWPSQIGINHFNRYRLPLGQPQKPSFSFKGSSAYTCRQTWHFLKQPLKVNVLENRQLDLVFM